MTLRAAIYARVSSAAQRDQHTIESQLGVLRPFVKAQGWDLVGTYCDDGRSAKTGMLDRRDAFANLMRDAEAHRFDVLVVLDVNRLTRTGSIEERAEILGPFQRLGIVIATPSGGMLDLRSFLGEFYVTLQALVAAEDNRKRAEAIKAGKVRAIAEGRKPAGPTPYGLSYSRTTGQWSLHPERAPVVLEMFQRVAAGDACSTIADDFYARGIPGARGDWNRHRVWDIVRSRYPVGEWTVDKRKGIVIAVPAIVTEELWERAQQALLRHKKRGLRRTKHTYLLEGLATCGECGSPILIRSECGTIGKTTGRKSPSAYVCRRRKLEIRGVTRCTAAIVTTADADERVWAKLSELILNPELLAATIAQRRKEADGRDWQADLAGYKRRIAELDRTEAALVERFAAGAITSQALDPALQRLKVKRDAIAAQVRAAEAACISASDAQARLDDAIALMTRLAPALPNASPQARRELVARFIRPGSIVFRGLEIEFVAAPPRVAPASRVDGAVSIFPALAAGLEPTHESDRGIALEIRLVA